MSRIRALIAIGLMALCASITTAQRGPRPLPPPGDTSRGIDVIFNGGFEDNPIGANWSPVSVNGFSLICTNGDCGSYAARTGTRFAWFGGDLVGPPNEIGRIQQQLTLLNGQMAVLRFYLYRPTPADLTNDEFYVYFGDRIIWGASSADLTYGSAYTEVLVDLTPYIIDDVPTENLAFWGYDEVAPVTSWLLDDISLLLYDHDGNLLDNPGFERETRASLNPKWKLTATDGKDKVKCDKPAQDKYFAYQGTCTFVFRGSPSQKTKLTQTIKGSELTFPSVIGSDRWDLVYYTNITLPEYFSASVKFIYESGCPRATAQVEPLVQAASAKTPRGPAPHYLASSSGPQPFPCSGPIKKMKVNFKHNWPVGKQYLDHTGFFVHQPD